MSLSRTSGLGERFKCALPVQPCCSRRGGDGGGTTTGGVAARSGKGRGSRFSATESNGFHFIRCSHFSR